MNDKLLRTTVKDLVPYVAGEPIETVKEKYGVTEIIKLASNENPIGASPKAIEAMKVMLDQCQFYPDPEANDLRTLMADKMGLKRENLIITNGADNFLTIFGEAFINPGDETITCVPTFGSFRTTVVKNEGVPIELPLNSEYKNDLNAIFDHITDKTKAIYICNPNNPSGTLLCSKELEEFVNKVPENIIILLDEAYIEFIDKNGYKDSLDYVRAGKSNVIVVRTFSKIYGLAGLRIGYAVSSLELIDSLFRVKETFAANRIAIEGAKAAYQDDEFIDRVFKINQDGRIYLEEEFKKLGFDVVHSQSNFILTDVKTDVDELFETLKRRGIIIRPSGKFARVTIGTQYQNEKLIEALREIIK
ncbi:MAG: histidinol-phosphate transaminase [Clostridioides sp.]|jgi:histidinol-phosphate aminotransferase|nr:histidinol-phosphate transaminase [Clostridioides sp.]